MSDLVGKHCGSASFVRNGMAHGRQRYRCKACGRSFTATPARGRPPAMKALAVLLYGLGSVSQGMIAKLLGVSHVAVYKWIRAAGEDRRHRRPRRRAASSRSTRCGTLCMAKEQGLALAGLRPCGTANLGLGAGWA